VNDYRDRVHRRMDELAALRAGWLDREGATLGPAVIATAAAVAESTAQWAGEIGIFPTPDGGVQLEWSDDRASHSITIGPDLRMNLETTERPNREQRGDRAAPHAYLSTACLHGEHGYCQSNTGAAGTKVPAECKFCAAPCVCPCHADGGER
jgi:hypothetical protein